MEQLRNAYVKKSTTFWEKYVFIKYNLNAIKKKRKNCIKHFED